MFPLYFILVCKLFKWHLSLYNLLTFIDNKLDIICLFPLKLRKDLSSVTLKKHTKPTNQLYCLGKASLLHLQTSSPVLFLGLTVFWSVSPAAVTCSLTLSQSQWFGSKSMMNESW